jgi:YVTN family beta-propeller protein
MRFRVLGITAAALAVGSLVAPAAPAHRLGGDPVALVTAEGENELLAVSLPGGKILRRVQLAPGPETVAAGVAGPAIVVSPHSGTVTLLAWRSLRKLAVLRGFRSPEIAAIAPDGEWAYVTDSTTGDLSVIELATRRVVDRVFVGDGAHHLAISPDQHRIWVALGEDATTIVVLDAARPSRPRVIDRFHPPVPAHDLVFAPDGRTVWVSSGAAPYVSLLAPASGRLIATVPAGAAPQHIAFGRRGVVYVSSGFGSTLEMVDARTRKVIRRRTIPYGSFNVATAGSLVVTSSLFNGTVSEFTGSTLTRWLAKGVAPQARDLAISVW